MDTSSSVKHCGACDHPCGPDATCAMGRCKPRCGPKQVLCDGQCVALSVDENHCGACGRHCGGGRCEYGQCLPVVVTSGVEKPLAMVSDGTTLYWISANAVSTVPVDGARAPMVAHPTHGAASALPTRIVIDGDELFWVERSRTLDGDTERSLMKGLLDQGVVKQIEPLLVSPGYLGTVDASLGSVWVTKQPKAGLPTIGTIDRKGGGNAISYQASSEESFRLLAVVYYQQNNRVMTCRVSSCEPEVLPFPDALDMEANQDGLYVAIADKIMACLSTFCSRHDKRPVTVLSNQSPQRIALDDEGVYWSNTTSLNMCPLPKCSNAIGYPFAQGEVPDGPIAVDRDWVYYTTSNAAVATIRRVRKPLLGSPSSSVGQDAGTTGDKHARGLEVPLIKKTHGDHYPCPDNPTCAWRVDCGKRGCNSDAFISFVVHVP